MLYDVFFVVASFVFISALIIDLDSPLSVVARQTDDRKI